MVDLKVIEQNLFLIFENYYFKEEKWVLQKRIAWNKRGIPIENLCFFDYEYKVRKESQLNRGDLFDYYLIVFINNQEFEIDYDNWKGGHIDNSPESLLFKRMKFFSLHFFENLKDTRSFIDWLLSNYNPSRFSFT